MKTYCNFCKSEQNDGKLYKCVFDDEKVYGHFECLKDEGLII